MFRRLFLPSVIFSTGWALSDIADAVVVGQALGTVGLAGIAMVLPVYMINCALAHGLGLGGSVRFSQQMARGNLAEARMCFVQTILTAGLFSVATALLGLLGMDTLLSLLGATRASGEVLAATREYLGVLVASTPLFYLSNILNYYLYNDDNQRLAVFGSVVGSVSDIILNFTLVLGFGLGMRGAALSTTLGQVIVVVIYVIGLSRRRHHLHLQLPRAGWFGAGCAQLRAGFSSSVSYLYQMVFFIVCNNVLVRLGGDVAVAVFDVIQNVSYILLYLYEGTARAMQPLLSTFFGESARKDIAETRRQARLWGSGFALVFVALFEFAPGLGCSLFGVGGGGPRALTELALRIYCTGVFFAGANILNASYFVSCGVERAALWIQSMRGCLFLLPLVALGGVVGSLHAFWLIFPLSEFAAWCATQLLMRHSHGFRVRMLPEERIFRKTISGSTADVMAADQEIAAFCEGRGIDSRRRYAITLAVEEICGSIVRNGMRRGSICLTVLDGEDGDVTLLLRYDEDFFDPFTLQTEEASAGGSFDMDAMGILMVRKKAKDFSYRRYQGLNSLVVKL